MSPDGRRACDRVCPAGALRNGEIDQRACFGHAYSYPDDRERSPDTFVVKERSLDGSERKMRLMDMGKGHTESDLIMYLPDEGTCSRGTWFSTSIIRTWGTVIPPSGSAP